MKGWTEDRVRGILDYDLDLLKKEEQTAAPTRTNMRNTGKAFEKEIEMTAAGYQSRRIATLRKVDPPVAVIWPFDRATGKKVQRVIFKQNPWLDYAGVWTAHHGRMLLVEAKSTSNHRLPFNRHGGLTTEQCATASTWRACGAAVCIVWQYAGKVVLFTPEMLREAEARGDKSLTHDSGLPVPRGEGGILWDFLGVLESAIWPAKINGE